MEKKRRKVDESSECETGTKTDGYIPTRPGWCIAYYLCVAFNAALRAFFASTAYYLLALTFNCIDLQYTNPVHRPTPRSSPGTPGDEFFSIWKNLTGLAERPGMEVRYDRLYDNAERWLILRIFGSVRPDPPTPLQLANNFSGIIYLLFVFFCVQTATCGLFGSLSFVILERWIAQAKFLNLFS